MSELISGKEAKQAWANGKTIQIKNNIVGEDFYDLTGDNAKLGVFDLDFYSFRIKPRTITLNGIEVPAPIKKIGKKIKKEKEKENFFVYYIDSSNCVNGYSGVLLSDLRADVVNGKYWANVFIWRTEEEIKQVVEALREVFK